MKKKNDTVDKIYMKKKSYRGLDIEAQCCWRWTRLGQDKKHQTKQNKGSHSEHR